MRVAAAQIDVTGVVPTLCRVFEQVDGAYRTEERIVGIGDLYRRRKHGSGNEFHALVLAARLDSTGTLINEPVVEGVEQLQFEYGLRDGTDPTKNPVPITYKNAKDMLAALSAFSDALVPSDATSEP